MKILCSELVNELIQPVYFEKDANIEGIYPFLVMINSPAGTFKFQIKSGATVLFEKTFTSSDLKSELSTLDDYLYSFHPIVPQNPFKIKKGTYNLHLTHTGYTYSNSSFLAWGQQHEDRQNIITYTLTGSSKIPLAFRIKTKKEGVL